MILPHFTFPSARLVLQMSNAEQHDTNPVPDASKGTTTTPKNTSADQPNTQGITPADKIRYGQSIQEGGMGGKTTSSSGQANAEGTLLCARGCDEGCEVRKVC